MIFFVSDSYGNIPTTELFYQTMLTRIKPVGRGKQSRNEGKQREKDKTAEPKTKEAKGKEAKKGRTGMGTGILVASRPRDEGIVWGKPLPNFV